MGSVDQVTQQVDADLLQQILPEPAEEAPTETVESGQDLTPLFSQTVDLERGETSPEESLFDLPEETEDQDFEEVFEPVSTVGEAEGEMDGEDGANIDPRATPIAETSGQGETEEEENGSRSSGFLAGLWGLMRGTVDATDRSGKAAEKASEQANKNRRR